MKKLLSLFFAVVLALSLAVPVFAAENNYSITITNPVAGHTYEAYQIFSGDLHGKVLSNVKWGNGQTDHEVGSDATEAADALKVEADAEKLAKEINLSTTIAGTSVYDATNGKYVISGLAPGYYLVKDQDNSLSADANDAYTKFIVQIAGNATVNPKSSKPTVDKQVLDEKDDAEPGSTDGWGETADHAINESYQYKLIAKLPNEKDLDAYTSYKLVFHDTMASGVSFENIVSVKVTARDNTVTPITDYTCTATANQAGGSWSLTIADLKTVISDIKGANVEVIYNAHLNNAADISATGINSNEVQLEYSNNPNVGGEGSTGKTEKDMVWVFTYMMDNTKIDGDTKAPLGGAGFELYDAQGNKVKLVYDDSLSGYRIAKEGETPVEEMFSAADTGFFNIIGVDAGTYTLKEKTVPGGYNKCNDIEIKLEGYHTENPLSQDTASCVITKYQDGKATNTFTIENNQGAVLPETGGIGTVIFYVIGGVLVVGAAVAFITRKRMDSKK